MSNTIDVDVLFRPLAGASLLHFPKESSFFFTGQEVNGKSGLPHKGGSSLAWAAWKPAWAKLGDLEIPPPPSINLHSVTRCCFTWPAIQPPLAAVIVPVNCFSSLFDYKVSSEWLVYMFQSSFSLPEPPPPITPQP